MVDLARVELLRCLPRRRSARDVRRLLVLRAILRHARGLGRLFFHAAISIVMSEAMFGGECVARQKRAKTSLLTYQKKCLCSRSACPLCRAQNERSSSYENAETVTVSSRPPQR